MSGAVARPDVDDMAWFKSSYSAGNGGECVEVASWLGRTHVRDSKDKMGPIVSLTPNAWTRFVGFAAQHVA
ncbi:DUF397 domain-containing protein [Streptomyces sp. NPDC020747]|uniref:DUF397 domain-containing protein n=1 Tax=Streptomyces sp. NPDC020747 TaxID=3365086 RepID=UPI0037AC1451